MTQPTKWHVHPAIEDSDQPGHPPSLIRASLFAELIVNNPRFLHVESEVSDQTGWMPRLI